VPEKKIRHNIHDLWCVATADFRTQFQICGQLSREMRLFAQSLSQSVCGGSPSSLSLAASVRVRSGLNASSS
jgi:hypothetical protein